MPDDVKRPYDSPQRREQATATRMRIVQAARTLLLQRGYASTTMADVAAAAGVAVQTVYSAIGGGKAALASQVWDITLAGDAEQVPMSARPPFQAILDDPDPHGKLQRYAHVSREIYDRLGPVARVLRAGAAAGDADLQQLVETTEQQRLTGTALLARHLDELGALRPGLSVEAAGHRLWALNAPELADGLTLRCGWSLDELEDWMADSMAHAVLR
jgi:AcrR family transcriptional regulator